jgi:polysaccharide pyruvyl transferase WcaK-like protein/glycosyltransferase involved in cell wall biosynthesis
MACETEAPNIRPLVAIVTPVYNGNPWLARTLASVQAQTYPNLVHVVLDNASTDDTPSVIAAACGGRVPIITRRNTSLLPQIDNWNAAIALTPAQAQYVKFLCADDILRADCIERLVAVAESDPNIDLVTAVDTFGDQVKTHGLDANRCVYEGREVMLRILRGEIPWFPFHHLFFRVTPERLNEPFDTTTFPAPDADFVFRLLREAKMGFVNDRLFYTRVHEKSQTTAIGGDSNFIYTGLQRLDRFAGGVMSPGEIARTRTGIRRQILRHVIAWKALGQTALATEHLARLARDSYSPNTIEYITAVLTWPSHKLRKTIRRFNDGSGSLPKLTETQFLNGTTSAASARVKAKKLTGMPDPHPHHPHLEGAGSYDLLLNNATRSQTNYSLETVLTHKKINKAKRVAFYGHFDGTNFGNESTFQAIFYHLRAIQPGIEITCISDGHEAPAENYGIKAVPLSYIKSRSRGGSVLVKAIRGLPSEVYGWVKGFLALSRTHMLIVPGTGILTDAYGLRGWGPYNCFKWSILAKLRGCELLFVSVGAGPFYSILGRFLVKSALSLADFRSYRDNSTKHSLESIGFRADRDSVYPDLAFSLPHSMLMQNATEGNKRPVVGIGLMFYAERYSVADPTPETERTYLDILAKFTTWLIDQDNDVRLLIGDLADLVTKQKFRDLLSVTLPESDSSHIIDEPILSVENLLCQIGTTDIVVATRFHNVLLALLCNKPVIAISFHHKCESLMAAMGLSEYCLDIHSLKIEVLIEKFSELRASAEKWKPIIKENAERFRHELDKQYEIIFGGSWGCSKPSTPSKE